MKGHKGRFIFSKGKAMTKISWTEKTWNPITGCTKISQGCKHCYAERMAKRLQAMGQAKYANGFELTLHENSLDEPLHWHKPAMIFVNSMSDTFHKNVPIDFLAKIFSTIGLCDWHTFQILTKRPDNALDIIPSGAWHKNIWLGATVEDHSEYRRIALLRQTEARVKFLSIEPMLSPMKAICLDGIDWVIVGGESGPGARPMEIDWAREIRDKCQEAGVAFYMKQLGGERYKFDQLEDLPEDLRIREYPKR
jgi:protein gp37